MAEENKRTVMNETSQIRVRATIDVSMDSDKLNPVQNMSSREAFITLSNIKQALSYIKTKSKQFNCIFSPPSIDIEAGAHYYRISCNLTTTMETSDDDVYKLGKYELDACITLTTDSTGSLIADSSSPLVTLVQDIETICRELSKTQKYYIEDYKG